MSFIICHGMVIFLLSFYRGDFLDNVAKTRLVTVSGSPACAQTAHTLIVHKLKIFASEIGYN